VIFQPKTKISPQNPCFKYFHVRTLNNFLHVACNYHYLGWVLTWKYMKQEFWGKILVFGWKITNLRIVSCLRDNFSKHGCRKSLTNWTGFKLTTLVVIDSDCIGSCKSNYHTITTTMAPNIYCLTFLNGLPRYTGNWNTVESGVKHHNPNPNSQCC
jgi:hypothetical protein